MTSREHTNTDHYAAVKTFASKTHKTVPKVDFLLLNAGRIAQDYYLAVEDESTITVNVVCTLPPGPPPPHQTAPISDSHRPNPTSLLRSLLTSMS